jgi:hypothetical protein
MKRTIVFVFAFLMFALMLSSSGCRSVPPPPPDVEEKTVYPGDPGDSFYNDPVLKYLGWKQKDILDLFGEPDIKKEIGGPGGESFYYTAENISFIFAGFEEGVKKEERVVNNLDLFPGAKVLGIQVGMTFDEIEKIWGEPFDRGYSDYIENYTLVYWLGEKREKEMEGEIEMYFDAPADDSPTELLGVRWKKYWW